MRTTRGLAVCALALGWIGQGCGATRAPVATAAATATAPPPAPPPAPAPAATGEAAPAAASREPSAPRGVEIQDREEPPPPTPMPSVEIVSPAPDEEIAAGRAGDHEVKLKIRDWPVQTGGPHVHLILDAQPYYAVFDRAGVVKLSDVAGGAALAEGEHVLVAFPSRADHLSVKPRGGQDPSAAVRFWIGKAGTPTWKPTDPTLVYSRPKGDYEGEAARELLLDFYLLNVKLGDGGYTVHANVAPASGDLRGITIDRWRPFSIVNLPPGESKVRLELRDHQGRIVPGPWNAVERTIRVRQRVASGDGSAGPPPGRAPEEERVRRLPRVDRVGAEVSWSGVIDRPIGGRYRMGRLLRAGGMGVVCEATDEETGRRVALKLIQARPEAQGGRRAGDAPEPEVLARFHREARAASAAGSEHIVEVLATGTDEESGAPFMVMELLEGEDLQQVLKRLGPLPPDVALRIAAQACVGLVEAHEAGVIHRDVKPANLFLADDGAGRITVKILDFGIAKFKVAAERDAKGSTDLTKTGTLLGSPHYMSPEQVQRPKDIDARSDVWSLAIVLYKALTGRTPHQDLPNLGQVMLAICGQPPPPVQDLAPWVSPRVAALLHKALQRRPDDRYPTSRKMLDALAALLPGGWDLQRSALVPLAEEQRAVVAFRFDPEGGLRPSLTGSPSVAPPEPSRPSRPPSPSAGESLRPSAPSAADAGWSSPPGAGGRPSAPGASELPRDSGDRPSSGDPVPPPPARRAWVIPVAALALGALGTAAWAVATRAPPPPAGAATAAPPASAAEPAVEPAPPPAELPPAPPAGASAPPPRPTASSRSPARGKATATAAPPPKPPRGSEVVDPWQ